MSAAYGLPANAGWVARLAERCAPLCKVINASESGETTAGGLSRMPALLSLHKPQVVVLELGANDGLRGLPLNLAEANLAHMIEAAQAGGAKVLLVATAMPPNYGQAYGEIFKGIFLRLAARYHLPPPPFLLAGFATNLAVFQNDGLHPVAAMQPRMADTVWVGLRPLLR